jgi:hypothetical protein
MYYGFVVRFFTRTLGKDRGNTRQTTTHGKIKQTHGKVLGQMGKLAPMMVVAPIRRLVAI